MGWGIIVALIAAALALGGGGSNAKPAASAAPPGGGGTPPPSGGGTPAQTPPPGVYDDCLDPGMPPEIASQVKALLTQAKAGTVTAAALDALANVAELNHFDKAAKCLRDQAASMGGGVALGSPNGFGQAPLVSTISGKLPPSGALGGPVAQVQSLVTNVTALAPKKPALAPPPNAQAMVDKCVAGIPEPYKTKIAGMLADALAGKFSADQVNQLAKTLMDLSYKIPGASYDPKQFTPEQIAFRNASACFSQKADQLYHDEGLATAAATYGF